MRLAFAVAIALMMILVPVCFAQDVEPAPASEAVPAPPAVAAPVEPPPLPIPTVTPNMSIFKRTPTIDGQVESGEWDEHFNFEYGELRAWAYVNWDENNLYVASKSTAPTDLLITLDANADSWFHGSDNYEFVARHAEGDAGPLLSVSRYDSHRTSDGGGAPTAAESSAFTMKAGFVQGFYVYELAIPKASIPGFDLRPGRKTGLKVAIGAVDREVQWIPMAPLGEVQTAELVVSRAMATDLLKVNAQIRDGRLAPGEELVAKITLKNTGASTSEADTIVIGGEGKTAKLLGSQLVRIEGIGSQKTYSTTFKTPVPRSAQPGSGALGVEVRAGDKRLSTALVSFDIVPSYEARLDLGSQPAKRGQYHRVLVIVHNNTQREAYGKVKLSLPKSWQFRRGDDVKEFDVRDEDGEQAVVFRVKAPQDAEKRTPVLAEVQVGGQALTASGVIEVE